MTKYKNHISLFALSLWTVLSLAQTQQYFLPGAEKINDYYTKFDNYSTQNGLSNNTIRVIFQDQYGYMWFGTEDGLNKFDGYEFTVYQNQADDSTSLSHNYINDITEDIYGNLWVATRQGLNKLNRTQGNFQHYFAIDTIENGLRNSHIKALLADSLGNLWVDTYDGYFHQYKILKDSFLVYAYDAQSMTSYPFYEIWQERKELWLLYGAGNTAIFNTEDKTFEYLKDRNIQNNNDIVEGMDIRHHSSIIKDDSGNYYLGTIHNRGVCYHPKDNKANRLSLPSVYTMIKHENSIWMGGFSFGILKYNIINNTYTVFKHHENDIYSLPNNMVKSLLIDRMGNLWIGTQNGLAKLSPEKQRFKNIRHIAGEKNAIIANGIKDVIQSKDGSIWVGTYEGISKLDLSTNQCVNYKHEEKVSTSLINNRVKALYEDLDTTLWIGTWSGSGFDRFNKKTETFSHFQFDSREGMSTYDWYTGFVEDSIGNFYPLFWGGPMSVFDRESNRFTKRYSSSLGSHHYKINDIVFFNDSLWIRDFIVGALFRNSRQIHWQSTGYNDPRYMEVENDRLAKISTTILNGEDFTARFINQENIYSITIKGILRFNKKKDDYERLYMEAGINCISKGKEKNAFWIGTVKGLKQLSLSQDKSVLTRTLGVEDLLSGQYISCLFLDKSKALWIGTRSGLYILNDTLQSFGKTLINNHFTAIQQDLLGNVWIGTKGGLHKFFNDSLISYSKKSNHILSDQIHDIYLDYEGDIWVATQKGLSLYSQESESFYHFQHDPAKANSISHNIVYSITGNKKGKIFIGTEVGASTINKKTNIIKQHDEGGAESIQCSLVLCGLTDSDGNVWLGNDKRTKSLNKLNPKTNKIKHYVDRTYDSTSYKGNIAYFIYQDKKGIIWVGSDKGLNKYNKKEDNFSLFTINDGLPTVGMLEDKSGHYWLSTTNGLVKFKESDTSFVIYTNKDGLASNMFTPGAYTELYSGELVFGGDHGLVVFHPDSIKPSPILPRTSFTKFFIFDSLAFDDLNTIKNIELDYKENNFSIEFSVFDFINSDKNNFVYKMEGYDEDWIYADSRNRKAKYTNLPYGEYAFLLKASNHDGVWMKEPVSIGISISAPWYQTIAAYVLYVIFLVIIMLLYNSFRNRRLRSEKRFLERLIAKRTNEVLEKNEKITKQKTAKLIKQYQLDSISEKIAGQEEERKRISMHLHNGIGSSLVGVKLYLENLMEELQAPELNIVLLDIEKTYQEIRTISHDLMPPEFEQASIKEVIRLYISQINSRSDIIINLIVHPPEGWSDLEENLQVEIYRIIQELLSNAIKYSMASEIDVQLLLHADYINITVEDEGVGIGEKQRNKGIGLKSINSRVEHLGGSCDIDSQKGRGAMINIEIPI